MKTHYRIRNTYGLQGVAWSREYASFAAARRALRELMRWDRVYLSPDYTTDQGRGWSAYASISEMRADDHGAVAPMIERVRT